MFARKKRVFVFLALAMLMLLPIASAKIAFTSGFREMYNRGETLFVDGYIVAEETATGKATVELQCPGYSKENSVTLNINKGQKVTFSGLFGVSSFTFPEDVEGSCDVEASFDGESINSDSFTVLDDLLGTFTLDQDAYKLGSIMQLDGIIFKLDGEDVSGNGKVFFEKEGSYAVQVGDVAVSNGELFYSHQLLDMEYGTYNVDVKVEDDMGNSQYFESVTTFEVNAQLDVDIAVSDFSYDPGDEVELTGTLDADDSSFSVDITFDSLSYTTTAEGSSFDYRFFVPTDLEADEYTLRVVVTDSFGNEGIDELILVVEQVPADIQNTFNAETFEPGETLVLSIGVFDQAGLAMEDDVRVEITDPVGKQLYNGAVNTAQDVELVFGKYTVPGTYTIISSYTAQGLEDTDRITVNEVELLTHSVDTNMLTLKNEGNILYEKRVDVLLVGEDNSYHVVAKDLSLEPGHEETFDLSYDLSNGRYTLVVDDSGMDVSELGDRALIDHIDRMVEQNEVSFATVSSDNRPVGKRFNQGFSSITGGAVISSYDRSVAPLFLVLVAFIFVGLVGMFVYQRRELIRKSYQEYKRKRHREKEDEHLADVEYGGDGDVPQEEVEKLLASTSLVRPVAPKSSNIGTLENKRVASVRVKGLKPGTTSVVVQEGAPKSPVKSPFEKKEKKKNRFSTWSPPASVKLSEKTFPAKNPIKEEQAKEETLYADIDEDFLRDEEF